MTLALRATASTGPTFGGAFRYAQSSEFWDIIHQIESHSTSIPEIEALLDDHFNEPDEGFGTFKIQYTTPTSDFFYPLFTHNKLALRADFLAGGVARNRIFPELKGYKTSSVQAEFHFLEIPTHESPWGYELGSILGIGDHESIDGLALDLYPKPSIRKRTLFYWGLDLSLSLQNHFDDFLRTESSAAFYPTLFYADSTNSPYAYDISEEAFALRWRTQTEWAARLISGINPLPEIFATAIGGQQPTPVRILPRTWDAVHRIQFDPSLGQLVGLGSGLILRTEDFHHHAKATVGFFGGYFGAVFQLKLKWFEANAGTLGFEQTSGYRITESRIKYIDAGVRFEI